MNNQIIKSILDRITTLERNQRNLIRAGNVKSLKGRKVIVEFEDGSDFDYFTPYIPWVPLHAGEVLDWRAPTKGEAVIVLNLSGGDDEANSIAIPAMYNDTFKPDSLDPNKTYTRFSDVFRVETDSQGNHTLKAVKSITFETKDFNVKASSSVNVDTTNYNRDASKANTKGEHKQTGNVKVIGALDVSVSIKTPALSSYAPGAFSMNKGGAVINKATITVANLSSCSVNNKPIDGHTHNNTTSPF